MNNVTISKIVIIWTRALQIYCKNQMAFLFSSRSTIPRNEAKHFKLLLVLLPKKYFGREPSKQFVCEENATRCIEALSRKAFLPFVQTGTIHAWMIRYSAGAGAVHCGHYWSLAARHSRPCRV